MRTVPPLVVLEWECLQLVTEGDQTMGVGELEAEETEEEHRHGEEELLGKVKLEVEETGEVEVLAEEERIVGEEKLWWAVMTGEVGA